MPVLMVTAYPLLKNGRLPLVEVRPGWKIFLMVSDSLAATMQKLSPGFLILTNLISVLPV